MIRLGVSLPALMQMLGHKDIRMTMRYVQVTQRDLQREFHLARQHAMHGQVLIAGTSASRRLRAERSAAQEPATAHSSSTAPPKTGRPPREV
jgi:hypothetical protein